MGWDGMVQVGGHHDFCDRWGGSVRSGQGGSCNENTTIKQKFLATLREERERFGRRVQPLLQ